LSLCIYINEETKIRAKETTPSKLNGSEKLVSKNNDSFFIKYPTIKNNKHPVNNAKCITLSVFIYGEFI
jgi:hypothetical protein